MVELIARGITCKIDATLLVEDASLAVLPGELVALIGPNGAGKSSLIRSLVDSEIISKGTVHIGTKALHFLSPLERARLLAYLPQQRPLAWPLRVRDVVALGRFAYGGIPGRLNPADTKAVTEALDRVGIPHLADRCSNTLSGGEQALMHIARAFATETPLLIADEPLAALDPANQWQVMQILQHYVEGGKGALVVLHDIALAACFADRLIWMANGRVVADGPPAETLTTERLAEIYGVSATITNGVPSITGVI